MKRRTSCQVAWDTPSTLTSSLSTPRISTARCDAARSAIRCALTLLPSTRKVTSENLSLFR